MDAMERLEEYNRELLVDTQIDEINVKDVQMKLPAIKHKWVSRLIHAKRDLREYEILLDKTKEKISDDLIKETQVVLSKPAALNAVEKHSTIKEIRKQIENQKYLVEYLEQVQAIFRSMTYDIKNIVEIMKLETL